MALPTLSRILTTSTTAAAAFAALAAGAPSPASAELGEWGLSLGAGVLGVEGADDTLSLAPTLSFALRYGVSDFWLVGATLDGGPAFSDGLDGAFSLLSAELGYAVDIVTWVPRLTLGVGALATWSDTPRVDLALSAGLGLEYREDRDWALLFSGRYHYLPTDDASAFSFSLGLTLYFE